MTYPGLDEESPKDTYEGDMVQGKREGQGKYTFASGGVYDGAYSDNKKSGSGKMDYPDGSKYEGTLELHRNRTQAVKFVCPIVSLVLED